MKKDYTSTRRTPRHSWGKKIHWEKKCKKTIHTRAVRLAIPGKQKVHWEQKGKKTLHTHAVRLAIPGKKKVHWEQKGKKTVHTHTPYASPFLEKKSTLGKKSKVPGGEQRH